jgi:hypothetical protein
VYIEYDTVLVGAVGSAVGAFSAAAFVDFTQRKPLFSNKQEYGIVGIGTYGSSIDKHMSLLKSYLPTWTLDVHDVGTTNQLKYKGAQVEGRLSAGFVATTNDRRAYLGGKLLASSASLSSTSFSSSDSP